MAKIDCDPKGKAKFLFIIIGVEHWFWQQSCLWEWSQYEKKCQINEYSDPFNGPSHIDYQKLCGIRKIEKISEWSNWPVIWSQWIVAVNHN